METLFQYDLDLQRTINQGWSSPALDILFATLNWLGVGWVQITLIMPLLAIRATRMAAGIALLAWASSGLINLAIKAWVTRLRPSNLAETILPMDERNFLSSFPSGHTVTAFAVATALALSWPNSKRLWIGAILFLLAVGVGIARVYRGQHWPSDVIGGAALGSFCGIMCSWVIQKRR
jgi:membrane-associated phospholipid phosphatase